MTIGVDIGRSLYLSGRGEVRRVFNRSTDGVINEKCIGHIVYFGIPI
jgi:hypothetical protein